MTASAMGIGCLQHALERRGGPRFRGPDGLVDARQHVSRSLAFGSLVPHAAALEILTQARHWITFAPGGDLFRRLVAARIVGRGVRPNAVGDGFDKHRSLPGSDSMERPPNDREHRERVVAVDQDTWNTVRQAFLGERFAGRLVRTWNADRPV